MNNRLKRKQVIIMAMVTYQYQLFLLAVSFFTRIPVNINLDIQPTMLSQASRYFALVGTLVGCLLALGYTVLIYVFPVSISILLTMALGLLLTGAFHEDGWADVWDGFGGGWGVTQKLNIMKDSRLGTYGASALFVLLLLKYQSLLALASFGGYGFTAVFVTLVVSHTVSRMVATSLIYSMSYVSEDAKAKVKPIASQLSFTSLMVLIITSIFVLALGLYTIHLFYAFTLTALVIFIVGLSLFLVLTRYVLMFWFNHQLGGFTGDCLGAAQQLIELLIYLLFIIFFKDIIHVS
jgi:adenosylcobinamide-GDP ribazoletransferase